MATLGWGFATQPVVNQLVCAQTSFSLEWLIEKERERKRENKKERKKNKISTIGTFSGFAFWHFWPSGGAAQSKVCAKWNLCSLELLLAVVIRYLLLLEMCHLIILSAFLFDCAHPPCSLLCTLFSLQKEPSEDLEIWVQAQGREARRDLVVGRWLASSAMLVH